MDRAFLADITMDTDPLVVFGSPEGYWKNNQIGEREFYLDNHLAFTISLSKGNVAVSNLSAHVMESFLFDMKDWRLRDTTKDRKNRDCTELFLAVPGKKSITGKCCFRCFF